MIDLLEMQPNHLRRYAHPAGNLLIGKTALDQLEDFPLATRELVELN